MRLRPILTPTVLCPALSVAACLVLAGPAAAQQAQLARDGQALGLRYLTWSGKTERAGPATVAPSASGGRRPAAIIPRRASAPTDAPPPLPLPYARETRYGPVPSNGLTPASAWLSPAPRAPAPSPPPPPPPALLPAPAYAAAVELALPPVYRPASVPAPQPMPSVPEAAVPAPVGPALAVLDPMAPRRDAPIFRMRSAASPSPAVPTPASPEAAPQAVIAQAADPMAPRRDAPIFRMQSAPAPPAAASSQAPSAPTYAAAGQPVRDGARYYSVHRAAGRQPDPTALPTSVYLDHVPLNLTDTPTSTDLAEPPAAPPVTRTINGRAQVIAPNEDPNLP